MRRRRRRRKKKKIPGRREDTQKGVENQLPLNFA
jgi:hypothetical protein